MKPMTYTYKGNDPAAHQRAVLEKRLQRDYGTADIKAAFDIAVARARARGLSRLEAIRVVGKEDAELYAAHRGPRPVAPGRARVA